MQTFSAIDGICRKILVIIPAYNAERSVGGVVRALKELNPHLQVLVIDDGSTDGTGTVATAAGAAVIRHEKNLGKGVALKTGFKECIGRGFQAVITLDADGQHAPGEVHRLIDRWSMGQADIIVGSRQQREGRMPLLRLLCNRLSSRLVSLVSRRAMPDALSGFRLISRRVLENVHLTSRRYEIESEILIKAAYLNFRIEFEGISTIYGDERSYMHPVWDTFHFIGVLVRSLYWRFRPIGR